MSYTNREYSGFVGLVDTTAGYLCGQVNDFVVIAPRSNPYAVQWCAIGDPTSWPTPNTDAARAVQAGIEVRSSEFGIVTGIGSGDFFGYVFQEKAVTKMTYVGGDIVFAFDTFEEGRGCFEMGRFAQADDTIFYESKGGYKSVTNGIVADIGAGSIDDTYPPQTTGTGFAGNNANKKEGVAVNISRNLAFFESQNLVYNWLTRQWSRVPALDGRAFYDLDDKADVIGQSVLVAESGYSQTSAGGTAQAAEIETGDADLTQGETTYVGGVRPLVDGGTWSVRVGSRPNLSTTISWSTATSVTERTGLHDFREEGRYQRIELTNSDGFETLMGADIDAEPAGKV